MWWTAYLSFIRLKRLGFGFIRNTAFWMASELLI